MTNPQGHQGEVDPGSRPLATIFAATHIASIKAKIADWRAALEQAYLNSWFASDSCILLPRIPRNSDVLSDAEDLGIRVLVKETNDCDIRPMNCSQARSYVSWLFNDWAWRAGRLPCSERTCP
jgi:hypothetical protein